MKGFLLGLLGALKLPVKLLKGLVRKKKLKISKKEKNLRAYVWNFSPGRLKNVSWRKSDRKGGKKRKSRKFSKKTNNFSKNRNY